jgi:hypothetical protein
MQPTSAPTPKPTFPPTPAPTVALEAKGFLRGMAQIAGESEQTFGTLQRYQFCKAVEQAARKVLANDKYPGLIPLAPESNSVQRAEEYGKTGSRSPRVDGAKAVSLSVSIEYSHSKLGGLFVGFIISIYEDRCGLSHSTVHCTLYTVHCTLYTAHCTLHTAHCTLHTVHCTLYTVHCTLYTILPSIHHTLYSGVVSPIRLHTVHYTYHTPYTIHHTPYTIHHTPYTIHHTPYTIHYTYIPRCGLPLDCATLQIQLESRLKRMRKAKLFLPTMVKLLQGMQLHIVAGHLALSQVSGSSRPIKDEIAANASSTR